MCALLSRFVKECNKVSTVDFTSHRISMRPYLYPYSMLQTTVCMPVQQKCNPNLIQEMTTCAFLPPMGASVVCVNVLVFMCGKDTTMACWKMHYVTESGSQASASRVFINSQERPYIVPASHSPSLPPTHILFHPLPSYYHHFCIATSPA